MSSLAVPYWGELNAGWGTATTATGTVARSREEPEDNRENPQQVVFIVATHEASFSSRPREVRYGVRGVPKMPRVFVLEAPVSLGSLRSVEESFTLKESEPFFWRGFFPVQAARHVLFSETMELHTGKLRRLSHRVSIDRRALEREDA